MDQLYDIFNHIKIQLENQLNIYYTYIEEYLPGTERLISIVKYIISLSLLVFGSFIFGTILYFLFYWLLIPSAIHNQHIFFNYGFYEYTPNEGSWGHSANPDRNIRLKDDICINNECNINENNNDDNNNNNIPLSINEKTTNSLRYFPHALIDFHFEHTQWQPTELATAPLRNSHIMWNGQAYTFELIINLPKSELNKNIGIFMIHSKLLNDQGDILATSSRPGVIPYESSLVSTMKTIFWWPLVVFGFKTEEVTLNIELFSHYTESNINPMRVIDISLSPPNIQIASGSLYIRPQLYGIRYLMHDWFFSTTFFGISMFSLMIIISVLLIFIVIYVMDDENLNNNNDVNDNNNVNNDINNINELNNDNINDDIFEHSSDDENNEIKEEKTNFINNNKDESKVDEELKEDEDELF